MSSITFKNIQQVSIWSNEMAGQISDGMWENSRNSSWKLWCDADAIVGTSIGREGFHPNKDNFNLSSPKLLSVVGGRIRFYARMADHFPDDVEIISKIESAYCGWCDGLIVPETNTDYKMQYRNELRDSHGIELCDMYRLFAITEKYTMQDLKKDLNQMKVAITTIKRKVA